MAKEEHLNILRQGIEEHPLGRIGKVDPVLLEQFVDRKIDVLLNVHVVGVVAAQDIVYHLEQKRRVAIPFEMCPIEARPLMIDNDILDHLC